MNKQRKTTLKQTQHLKRKQKPRQNNKHKHRQSYKSNLKTNII